MKLPEILAPAGSMEALIASVRAGADAVYVGARQFNARQRGNNLTLEELQEATRYCHLHQVAIYATVNILIKEEELEEVMILVDELYELGVDGLIVQDLGLFSLVHERYPDFPLHSSTQMFIHGSPGVHLLEELGFQRVVLARELTLDEIKQIKEVSKAEIKIFCHGALCISYSGQCYMSSLIGGRSGNRGRCAQPCRKTYSLYDENEQQLKQGHLISPKDLNTLDLIEEIVETGVDSLKIEGRLKNPQYVYTSVRAYREALDGVEANSAVNGIFNRKYSQGYLKKPDPTGENLIVDQESQMNKTFIGTVEKVDGYKYRFQAKEDLSAGDGIWISGSKSNFGEILSSLYDENKRSVEILSKGKTGFIGLHKPAEKGDKLYKTSDIRQQRSIEESMKEDHSKRHSFSWEVQLEPGHNPVMKITLGQEQRVIYGENPVQEARKAPLSKERVVEQLEKFGDTPFKAEDISVTMEGAVFMPISAVNQLRRQTVEALEEMVLAPYRRPSVTIAPLSRSAYGERKKTGVPTSMSVRVKDLDMLDQALTSPADEIIYGWDDPLDWKELNEACEMAAKVNRTIRLAIPKIIRDTGLEDMQRILEMIKDHPIHGYLVGSYEGLDLTRNAGKSVEADQGFNIFNSATLEALASLDVELAYMSSELNQQELEQIKASAIKTGLVVHGRKELMVMQYGLDLQGSPAGYSLEDQKGYRFPIMKDGFGRVHLYNSRVLCLLDRVSQLHNIDKIRMDALFSEPRLEEMVTSYKEVLEKPNGALPNWFEEGLDIWTKGHFNRGVL